MKTERELNLWRNPYITMAAVYIIFLIICFFIGFCSNIIFYVHKILSVNLVPFYLFHPKM